MNWVTSTFLLPKGPRASGAEALEVAKQGWESLKSEKAIRSVEGLEDGFDAVFECTGVESCMQLSVMVSHIALKHFFPSRIGQRLIVGSNRLLQRGLEF